MSTTPAAWYADPNAPGQLRWWDGGQWTSHTAPAQGAAPPVQPVVAGPPPGAPIGWEGNGVGETLLAGPSKGGLLGGKKQLEDENAQLRAASAPSV